MRVVAPGKLVVVGEYAVVDGAPAVVVAVDRGVSCAVTPGPVLAIDTPTGDDRFVRPALADAPPGTYTFRDWNPVPSTTKVGLGGSAAAVTAAVLAAGVARGAPPAPDALCARATAIHRAVQGSGSAIDVAASAHGGVLRFEGGAVSRLPGALVPDDRLLVVFSGDSASTGPRVERYRAWRDRAAFAAESARIVDGFAADPIGAVSANAALLRAMADAAGIAYWTEAIGRLADLARDHGGAAKPSGAGGGDVVVALFPTAEAARGCAAAARASGFLVVPVAVAPGARVG